MTKNWEHSRWKVKQTVAHLYHGMWLSNEKKWTANTHNSLDESPGNYAEWKWKSQRLHAVWFHPYNVYEMIKA